MRPLSCLLILGSLLTACSSPTTSTPTTPATGSTARTASVSFDLTDSFYPGTITAGTGDDRADVKAHFGVEFWVEDSAGLYVDTVQYYLATETSHNTMAGTYTGNNPYTHLNVGIGNATTGIARSWLNKAGSNAGVDGVTGATIFVDHSLTPNGHFAGQWDGKDRTGTAVANGDYHLKVLILRHSGVQYGGVLHSFLIHVGTTANSTSIEDTGFPVAYDSTATTTATVPSTLDNTDSNFSASFTP